MKYNKYNTLLVLPLLDWHIQHSMLDELTITLNDKPNFTVTVVCYSKVQLIEVVKAES